MRKPLPLALLLGVGSIGLFGACATGSTAPTQRQQPGAAPWRSFTDHVIDYLDRRWIVTQQSPVVVLCGAVSDSISAASFERIGTEARRVVQRLVRHQNCDADVPVDSTKPSAAIVRLRSWLVDEHDSSSRILQASTDTRTGYYLTEVMRFKGIHGVPGELTFSGFEHYVGP